jgi:hypothetical protein
MSSPLRSTGAVPKESATEPRAGDAVRVMTNEAPPQTDEACAPRREYKRLRLSQ